MIPNRKRSNPIKKWFRKNLFWFILLSIVLVSMGVGVVIGHALPSNSDCPKATASATTSNETVGATDSEQPALNTDPVKEETEPVLVYWDIPLSEAIQDYIRMLSMEYSVPEELILAMIEVESSFRPSVVSSTGDYGYMQINECNHEWLKDELGVTDFLDPYQNILCGVYILSGHLEKTDGDIAKALMRYNNGPTGAYRLWQKGVFETSYTKKITTAYESYIEKSRPDGATSKAA